MAQNRASSIQAGEMVAPSLHAFEKELHKAAARREFQERLVSLFSPLLLLILWELLVQFQILDFRFFSRPSVIASFFWKMILTGELLTHVNASLVRIGVGFLMGVVPGILLGIIMGLSRIVRAGINPMVAATFPIPKIAILPLILLIFGLGEQSKYVIVAIGTFYFVLINTMTGVMTIDKIYLDVGKNFGASRVNLWRTVALPGALPMIFAGIKLGWGVALLLIVAAEFVGAKSGIGFLIWNSWQVFSIEQMFVGLIVISGIGFTSFLILDEVEKVVVPWKAATVG
ncbi:MAG: ABC transporter permease [Dehalococcoidia bacterium]|nr:ABC transporter permease [Dehalococcoidia bacterium]